MQEKGIQGASGTAQAGWGPSLWGSGQGQGGRPAPKGGRREWGCYRASLAPLSPALFPEERGEEDLVPQSLSHPLSASAPQNPAWGVQGQWALLPRGS